MDANPPLYDVERVAADRACAVGHFGRILTYDESPPGLESVIEDRATVYHNRLRDGTFINDDGDDTGVAVGQGWTVWRTTNSGDDWVDVSGWTLDDGNWATGVDLSTATNPGEYGVMIGTGMFVAISDDYGATWDRLTSSPTEIPSSFPDLHAVAFVPNSSTVYAVGNAGAVLKSTNNGANWALLSDLSDEATQLLGVSFVDANTGYVCGGDGKVYKTTNGGTTFSSYLVNGNPSITFRDIAMWSVGSGDGTAGIVVGDGGAVYKKDGTDTRFWPVSHGTGVTQNLLDIEALGSGTYLRVSGEGGAIIMTDNEHSGTWSAVKSQTTSPIHRLSFQSSNHGFGIGATFTVLRYHP